MSMQKKKPTLTRSSIPTKEIDPEEDATDRIPDEVLEQVLPARYLVKDNVGDVIEDPEDLFPRVAHDVALAEKEFGGSEADIEKWEQRFEELLSTQQFMLNSPALMNAGAGFQQLSACFVNSPDDSMTDIFQTSKEAAQIMQTGGGVGYSFSQLRPKGDIVHTSGGRASGPVSFMQVFDTMCATVEQGGRRRGAQMAILRADHPDVLRFIVCKRKEGEFANFNISVGITDDFIEAWQNGEDYTLINPRTNRPFRVADDTAEFYNAEYEDSDPAEVEENFWRDYAHIIEGVDEYRDQIQLEEGEEMTLPADFIWSALVDGAWRNGEPGFVHLDYMNRDHTWDVQRYPEHEIKATNPCSEQPLEEYDACNLGHLNLSLIVEEDAPTWDEYDGEIKDYLREAIDWETLMANARDGTRMLDNVVERSDFPLEEIEEFVKGTRKIGIGIMGFAQLLIQLGIEYGSEESQFTAEYVMKCIKEATVSESHELAKRRGSFSEWKQSKYASPTDYPEWFEKHTGQDPEDWAGGFEMRNYKTTTIAPTGTTSRISNTSGGCEPLYRVIYQHNAADDIGSMVVFDDLFMDIAESRGYDIAELKEKAVSLMETNDLELEALVDDDLASLFKTADQVTPEEHVGVQAAFQKHVASSISKTVNLPNEATHDDVKDVYRLAIESGLKSVAIYRDGSRHEQVMTDKTEDNKLDEECPECGQNLEFQEGCKSCPSCFFEKCEV